MACFAFMPAPFQEILMAEIKRTRRNTLERRCLGKAFKRLFIRAPKSVFKMLEKVKRV
jgi:hypothetical protein